MGFRRVGSLSVFQIGRFGNRPSSVDLYQYESTSSRVTISNAVSLWIDPGFVSFRVVEMGRLYHYEPISCPKQLGDRLIGVLFPMAEMGRPFVEPCRPPEVYRRTDQVSCDIWVRHLPLCITMA
jgi:hypothetical protein